MRLFDIFKGSSSPLVEQSQEDLGAMLDLTRNMFEASTNYLLHNEPISFDLKAKDEIVNEKERAVRRAVLEHLAVAPEQEMVFSLILISIVQDAERIGDLAKSLEKVTRLANDPRDTERIKPLKKIRDRILGMFEKTRYGFTAGEVEPCRSVMEENDRIKEETADFIEHLAHSANYTANETLVFGIAARLIGRVGSNLSNIASTVVLPFDQIRRSTTWADDE